jgi:hypothetical protein
MREEHGRAESYARRSGRRHQPVSDNAHITPGIGSKGTGQNNCFISTAAY